MINIERTKLAKMERPYAVAIEGPRERPVFYAASEARAGRTLCFDGPNANPTVIASGPGGCMGIVALDRAALPGVLMVEGFFPIFQSEHSGAAIYSSPKDANDETWQRQRVFDLPFLHRFALVTPQDRPLIIAGQLCRSKNGLEDWSRPGAVYAVVPGAGNEPWRMSEKPLLDGLHRNHGMFTNVANGKEEVYVSADEGIFKLSCCPPDCSWQAERIIDLPTSDLWMFDLDNDGEQELVAIQPFHGDIARIFKRRSKAWETVWEKEGKFGHVVWAGRLRGRSCVMLGWRGGDQALNIHILEDSHKWQFRKMALDVGVAPLNVSVRCADGGDLVLASHGTINEVVLYTLK